MTTEKQQHDPAVVSTIQQILDRSAGTASPDVARSFSARERRLSAEEFLDAWAGERFCTVATSGENGQPHIAVVHAGFVDDKIRMLVFEGSVRERDLAANPRVALSKHNTEGIVMRVYGKARPLEEIREVPPDSGHRARRYEIDVNRIYAMGSPRQ